MGWYQFHCTKMSDHVSIYVVYLSEQNYVYVNDIDGRYFDSRSYYRILVVVVIFGDFRLFLSLRWIDIYQYLLCYVDINCVFLLEQKVRSCNKSFLCFGKLQLLVTLPTDHSVTNDSHYVSLKLLSSLWEKKQHVNSVLYRSIYCLNQNIQTSNGLLLQIWQNVIICKKIFTCYKPVSMFDRSDLRWFRCNRVVSWCIIYKKKQPFIAE